MGASLLSFVELFEFVIYLITNYVRRNRLTKKSSHLVSPMESTVKPEIVRQPNDSIATVPIQIQMTNVSDAVTIE